VGRRWHGTLKREGRHVRSCPQPRLDHDFDHVGEYHAGRRQYDPQRRPAAYPREPVGLAGPDRLGVDLLYRLRRDHDAADWLVRRPVRYQICLPGLGHRFHARFRAVRRCHEPPGTRLLSRIARCGWCRTDPAISGYPVSDQSAGAPRARNGDFWYRDNPRANYGAGARRLVDL
jgi:hypothetical protein